VILVDHGSPLPEVTATRHWLANALRQRLPKSVTLLEAVMERRDGADYDFNGDLLTHVLRESATHSPQRSLILAMQFISPGRHAGAGGDIAEMAATVISDFPALQVFATPLVGEHPLLIELLVKRLEELT
jgi:sirohydrochlorin ferrochelatase